MSTNCDSVYVHKESVIRVQNKLIYIKYIIKYIYTPITKSAKADLVR